MITQKSQYARYESRCCGTVLHRPADADQDSPWFCFDCGTAYDPHTDEVVSR